MNTKSKIRGVNLGGWLVLEKWMTPTLFANRKAVDETTFCMELGSSAEKILREHWESFITPSDFKWLKDHGINAVRIPIGHWIFGDCKPYFGAIDILDHAMETAGEYGVDVLLDLHAAPGCQNGFDNGGIQGVMEWHLHPENVDRSVAFTRRIAERYKDCNHLLGIQLLNEPRWDVPMEILREYYHQGYEAVREHIPAEKTAVVIHDGFRLKEWKDFMQESRYSNIILDTHMYQCFKEEERAFDISRHIHRAAVERKQDIDEMKEYFPVCVGEWSLGLAPATYEGFDSFQKETALRAYAAAQLLSFEQGEGWFFWSYKLEEGVSPAWNFRECVERGWLPGHF